MRRIILAFLLAMVLPGIAFAQDRAARKIGGPAGQVLDNLGVKPLPGPSQGSNEGNSTGGGQGGPLDSILMKPFQDLANFIGDDIDGAITLSTQIPEIQDGHGQQCLMALKTFGTIFKAHPKPLTFHLASDLEALRLFQISANNLCGNPHCTQVFADLATTIQTAAPVNFSIPIPSLHDLCSKVPQIAVVPAAPAAVTPPPPAPAPANP